MSYQEWCCATKKLYGTNTDRCLGIDELGRFEWHSVTDDSSIIEVDERVRQSQTSLSRAKKLEPCSVT